MELPQKIWPFGNVKGLLMIKYSDYWQNTVGGLIQEPQLEGPFLSYLAFVLVKMEGINNAHLEGSN